MKDNQYKLDLNTIRRTWIEEHKPVLAQLAAQRGSFTSDDLHEVFHMEPVQPNWVGCLFRQMAQAGTIRRIGYQKSERPITNGRVIAVWTARPL